MNEKDLDTAIEKCERIMEFDTRTLKNPESENGWIFEKVHELLQYLRQFQFATDTNVDGNLIDRQAALDAIKKLEKPAPTARHLSAIFDCEDTIKALPSAQPGWIPCSESPMKNNSYLVWMPFAPEGHHITVAEWCGSYWNIKTPITAWMPLPAPYIPEGDDKHEG